VQDWDAAPNWIDQLANQILTSSQVGTNYTMQEYTPAEIKSLESIGLEWNSFFADLNWISAISGNLIPANRLFDIKRGERRGWDSLFYPDPGHGIENNFIRPVLLSTRD